ncbi:LysE family translocator [Streptomyces canus]|uniref:Threonine/homoserine/homoserine lactone efflux protein n=1 Tax=Streptomyces canus TaxID=58343 RepID=A0AAW8FQG8_9ACTN|nr:LysE family translocator [Streptomyces canus]MDQ0912392.1 threonine/homoserine/homoserine lactone efflux protein [Streptomyces canus]MDQ1072378.1 threonine/homoserine/homoserine lactone efflux protein [Streptomyces canus]
MDGQIIAFTGVAAGMVAMPGADFTVVVRNALVSRRAGVACALGVVGGLLVHTALAVAGVAAVLTAVPALFRALQLLGGGYVLYLGVRTLLELRRTRTETVVEAGAAVRPLRQGFVTNALNPKVPITFLSLLPQFVPQGSSTLPRTLLLALIVVVLALVWFSAVAVLVDRLGRWLRRPRAARAVTGVTAGALTALGVMLLAEPLLAA